MRKSLRRSVLTALFATGFLFSQSLTYAQKTIDWGNPDIPLVDPKGFSIGMNIGFSDLWGDVGTKSFIDHYKNDKYLSDLGKSLRGMGGLFVRYTFIPGISGRLGFNYGALYATDEWNVNKARKAKTIKDDAYQRYVRNLDVNTNIWEGYLMAEISPLQLTNWEFGKAAKMAFQPYLLAGVSVFHFNPVGTHVNLQDGTRNRVDLQPLHTEGENFVAPGQQFENNYNLWSYGAVAGIGFRFDIGRWIALGLEYQLRFTFTDYLDDVSGKYIDPQLFDIAYLDQPGKANLARDMNDRSKEILPGYHHTPGEFRGDPGNKDKFSTVSLMFYWKINKRQPMWWKHGRK